MRYFSAFSGCGMFEIGISEIFKDSICVGHSDIKKHANAIYKYHFPTHINFGDITKINIKELPDFDLLVGGFPCQDISCAGKMKGFDLSSSTRSSLGWEMIRLLREVKEKPKEENKKIKEEISWYGGRKRNIKKSYTHLHKTREVKYQFIYDNRSIFHVEKMCRLLEVSRSGFYSWLERPESKRSTRDKELLKSKGLVITEFGTNNNSYQLIINDLW